MRIDKLSPECAKDLIELINSMKGLVKTAAVDYTEKNGAKTKFNYVPIDDMLDKVKQNDNFAFMQPLGCMDDGTPAIQCILIHRTGESIVSDPYRMVVKAGQRKQDEGSEITYSRRYSMAAFFGIANEDDDDATRSNEATRQEPQYRRNEKLSPQNRNELNNMIAEYKKMSGATNCVSMLEKELGKSVRALEDADVAKTKNILKKWMDELEEQNACMND